LLLVREKKRNSRSKNKGRPESRPAKNRPEFRRNLAREEATNTQSVKPHPTDGEDKAGPRRTRGNHAQNGPGPNGGTYTDTGPHGTVQTLRKLGLQRLYLFLRIESTPILIKIRSYCFSVFLYIPHLRLPCMTILTMLSLYDPRSDLLAKVAEHFISMYESPTDPYQASIEQAPIVDRGGMIQI
jgi:hypothetical protein